MKTRTGFVSNSSTCSFVVMGVPITRKQLDDLIDRFGEPDMDAWEFGEMLEERHGVRLESTKDDGRYNIMGIEIAHMSSEDYGLKDSKEPLANLVERIEAMKQKFGLEGETTIYTGTKGC